MGRWRRKVRSLGQAFVEVLQAEVESLLLDVQETGRGWAKGSVFFLAAAAFAFWAVGVFTAFAVAVLAIWLSVWQAAGIVLLVLLATTVVLVLVGRRVFLQTQAPTAIVRGHLDDHLGWWRENLAASGAPALEPPEEEAP